MLQWVDNIVGDIGDAIRFAALNRGDKVWAKYDIVEEGQVVVEKGDVGFFQKRVEYEDLTQYEVQWNSSSREVYSDDILLPVKLPKYMKSMPDIAIMTSVFNPSEAGRHRERSAVLNYLDDKQWTKRWLAVILLSKADPKTCEECLFYIRGKLHDSSPAVRVAVIDALGNANPHILEHQTEGPQILRLLRDSSRKEQESIVRLFTPSALAIHAEVVAHSIYMLGREEQRTIAKPIVRYLDSSDSGHERAAFIKIFSAMPSSVLKDHLPSLMQTAIDPDPVVRCECMNLVQGNRSCLLHTKGEQNNTLLHLVASRGFLEEVRRLVLMGAVLKVPNSLGETPSDLALRFSHLSTYDFLMSHHNPLTARGGTGNAFSQAMKDERPIKSVQWFKIPLPGNIGLLGAFHSLLAIEVGGGTEPSHTYVLEKAAQSRHAGETTDELTKHGVHVSDWVDVASNVIGNPLYELLQDQVLEGSGGHPMSMRILRDLAVNLGPYNVGTCNCHHAAQAVYNYCAKNGYQVDEIPNKGLSNVACSLKNRLGFDVATGSQSTVSESAAVGSPSVALASEASGLYEPSGFPIEDTCADGDHKWASTAAVVAEWIYHPSRSDSFGLCNATQQTIVVYVEELREEKRLNPGENVEFVVPPRALYPWVRLNSVGVFGLTSRRTRLARVQLQLSCCYTIKENPDGGVRCAPHNPLPSNMERETVCFADKGNLVQWCVVTTAEAIYVGFRGTSTDTILDVIIDLGFVTHDDAPHRLRVHGNMWNALHQHRNHVVNAVRDRVLLEANTLKRPVVLCGHSLGGGYAILTALDLLYQGARLGAVVTFGAPQVIVPEHGNVWWHALNDITTLYINSYDVVPRLPSCTGWIFQIIPNSRILNKKLGPLTLSVNLSQELSDKLGHQKELLEEYDTVGRLMFIGAGNKVARKEYSTDPKHKDVLRHSPTEYGTFIFDQHSISQYADIAAALSTKTSSACVQSSASASSF